MNTRLMVRCDHEVAELFRQLAEEEGRKQGKLLEILIEEYKKFQAMKSEYQKYKKSKGEK